jgi:coenzyme F420 hydrogenase subunit beta
MPVDPVCNKDVNPETPYKSVYKGQEYYFCSDNCKKKFDEIDRSIIRVRRFLRDKERISFAKLRKDIIKPGICTLCGACVASCEALALIGDKPTLVGKCTACGVCYNQCPRTITTPEKLIGHYEEAFTARTLISKIKGQNGGVVTSVVLYALDEGLIDCAVVTTCEKERPWYPKPVIVHNEEELLASAGSVYFHSSTIACLMNAIKQGHRSIGFVGTSCNIDAVHKMQHSPYGLLHLFMRANILKLGLFCMDTFDYEGFKNFFESRGVMLKDVEEIRIYKGKMYLTLKTKEEISLKLSELDQYRDSQNRLCIPLGDLNPYRNSSCTMCTDLTSENADISFGGVGSREGYTTVLIRTGVGREVFQDAIDRGYIKADPIEKEGFERVLNLARLKKVQMYMIRRRYLEQEAKVKA